MWFELKPTTRQKSFYGKAFVDVENGVKTLYSYETPIIRVLKDGTFERLWDGWSATTGKHINAFCGLNKADFTSLPIKERRKGNDLTLKL